MDKKTGEDHVAAGWNEDHTFRWIEVGRLRLEEDDKGAIATFRMDVRVSLVDLEYACSNGAQIALAQAGALRLGDLVTKMAQEIIAARKGVWLSAAELAGLTRQLAGWFTDDPTTTIRQIEDATNYVRIELAAWNNRVRIDEEHPPYDELVRALDGLLRRCRDLRELLGRFAEKAKVIIVDGEELR